jgi:hypothetical protein
LEGGDGGSIGGVNLGLESSEERISVGLEFLEVAQDSGGVASGGDGGSLGEISFES